MVIVFDGVCNLCNRWVQFLLLRDHENIFQFAPCQSAFGSEIMRSMGEDALDPSTVLLVDGNNIHVRSAAVFRVLAELGGPWRLVLALLIIPPPIRDFAYTLIAKQRYRWFGRTEQCMVPDPKWHSRFLL